MASGAHQDEPGAKRPRTDCGQPAPVEPPLGLADKVQAWAAEARAKVEVEKNWLHTVEVFAGVGSIASAFLALGMLAATYDKLHDEVLHDISTDEGLRHLVSLIVRVGEHGLVWFAPPCSTWVWIARSHSRRSNSNPLGDEDRADVRLSNEIAVRVSVLLQLCRSLRIWYVVEQPVSSLLLEHPDMRRAVACTGASSVSVELGRVGASSTKPLRLTGTAAWLNGVATQIKRRGRLQQPMALVERKGKWLNGVGKLLKDSAAYPEELGLHNRSPSGHGTVWR